MLEARSLTEEEFPGLLEIDDTDALAGKVFDCYPAGCIDGKLYVIHSADIGNFRRGAALSAVYPSKYKSTELCQRCSSGFIIACFLLSY